MDELANGSGSLIDRHRYSQVGSLLHKVKAIEGVREIMREIYRRWLPRGRIFIVDYRTLLFGGFG